MPPAPTQPAPAPAPATAGESREVRVTVINDLPGASESTVTLDLPQGWTSTPAEQPLKLARPDESQTLRFLVKPPLGTKTGEYRVRALVKQGGDGVLVATADERRVLPPDFEKMPQLLDEQRGNLEAMQRRGNPGGYPFGGPGAG